MPRRAFAQRVLEEGRLLYQDHATTTWVDFVEESLDLYMDFRSDYAIFATEFDQALVEEATHLKGNGHRPAVDPEKLRQKLQFIRENVQRLRDQAQLSVHAFVQDSLHLDAALRRLQVAIEAVLDIANHIIAREGLGTPNTYREAFAILCDRGILPLEKRDVFLAMAGFRERAVRLYEGIDPAEVHAILCNRLDDFNAFMRAIAERYLA